eukprot:TRINITY_DN14752_c0_g1_i2.p2 TRINITY_DN14752_c0_g1~~TRINITY_DN14752_c0_g1_i2.p2  ORF type:complete len:324 (+),score=86.63 TRINITY_DN14752_c0_g1_i2:78-1049(+)
MAAPISGSPLPRHPISPEARVKVCSGHTRPVPHIAYSGVVDGSFWFISSCHDGKPMLRNGETGDWVGTFEGHKGAVFSAAFNSQATQCVTASGDYSVKIWDALSGECRHSWQHPHCVKTVDWYEDGSRVVSGAMDKMVRVFDAERLDAAALFEKEGHDNQLRMTVIWGYDTNTLFSAAGDNVVKRWDLRTGEVSHSQKFEDLSCLEISRNNRLLVTCTPKKIGLHDPKDLHQVHAVAVEEADCADLAPDGRHVAVGSKLKAKEYDVQTGQELEAHKGHHGPVFHLKYAPDSLSFASGSEDGMVRIWPTTTLIRADPSAPKRGE